jgi:hypothetical protein
VRSRAPTGQSSSKTKTSQKLPTVVRSQASKGVLHSSTGSGAIVGYQNTQGTQRMVKYDTLYNRRSPIVGAPVRLTHQKREQHVSRLWYERQTPSCPSLAERSRARWAPRVTSLRLAWPLVASLKVPDPHGLLSPRPRDTCNPLARR